MTGFIIILSILTFISLITIVFGIFNKIASEYIPIGITFLFLLLFCGWFGIVGTSEYRITFQILNNNYINVIHLTDYSIVAVSPKRIITLTTQAEINSLKKQTCVYFIKSFNAYGTEINNSISMTPPIK